MALALAQFGVAHCSELYAKLIVNEASILPEPLIASFRKLETGGLRLMCRFPFKMFPMSATYDWQQHYEAAILETDRSRLPTLIRAAETAIHTRVKELETDHAGSAEERQAIEDALAGLRVLQKESSGVFD